MPSCLPGTMPTLSGPGRVRQISLTQHSMSEAVTQDEVYAIVKGLRQDHPKIKQADLLRKAAVEVGIHIFLFFTPFFFIVQETDFCFSFFSLDVMSVCSWFHM